MTAKERQQAYREFVKQKAIENGATVIEGQIYSRRKPEFNLQVYPQHTSDEERFDGALEDLEIMEDIFGLDHQVIEDFKNGITDITYIDADLNSHIIHLEDDEEFSAAAQEIRDKTGAMPFIGFKWEGQHSPVFMCIADSPDCLGEKNGVPVMTTGSETGGIISLAPYRYIQLGVYFWINGELCDDYVEFEGHKGALYPVVAFPNLAIRDGIRAEDVPIIRDRKHREKHAG